MSYFFYLPGYTGLKLECRIFRHILLALKEASFLLWKFLNITTPQIIMHTHVSMHIHTHIYTHKMTWISLIEYYLYKSNVLIKKINSIHINARTILPDSRERYFKIMDKREESMDTLKKKMFEQTGINITSTVKKSYQKRLPWENSVPNSNFYFYPRQASLKMYYSESLETTNNKCFYLKNLQVV